MELEKWKYVLEWDQLQNEVLISNQFTELGRVETLDVSYLGGSLLAVSVAT